MNQIKFYRMDGKHECFAKSQIETCTQCLGREKPSSLKFSHNYLKLPKDWQGKKATLLFVREIELEKQTLHFIEYDTFGWDSTGKFQESLYKLPNKGKYLLLLFECEGTIFTTLRRWTREKGVYYATRKLEDFKLVKTEDDWTCSCCGKVNAGKEPQCTKCDGIIPIKAKSEEEKT